MTNSTIQGAVLAAIIEVAPDLEPKDLDSTTNLHDDLGLDSIDLLNIASEVAERTGFEIPESEMSRLHSVGDLIDFVERHAGEGA
jgi:acyl carrier protein